MTAFRCRHDSSAASAHTGRTDCASARGLDVSASRRLDVIAVAMYLLSTTPERRSAQGRERRAPVRAANLRGLSEGASGAPPPHSTPSTHARLRSGGRAALSPAMYDHSGCSALGCRRGDTRPQQAIDGLQRARRRLNDYSFFGDPAPLAKPHSTIISRLWVGSYVSNSELACFRTFPVALQDVPRALSSTPWQAGQSKLVLLRRSSRTNEVCCTLARYTCEL